MASETRKYASSEDAAEDLRAVRIFLHARLDIDKKTREGHWSNGRERTFECVARARFQRVDQRPYAVILPKYWR